MRVEDILQSLSTLLFETLTELGAHRVSQAGCEIPPASASRGEMCGLPILTSEGWQSAGHSAGGMRIRSPRPAPDT